MLQAMLEKLQLPCPSIYLSQRICSRPEDIDLLCCLLYIAITWRPIFFDVTRNKGSKKKSRAFNTCSSPRWLIICSFSPSEGIVRQGALLNCPLNLQATMFNDEARHLNVLVASDATRMGLKLNIFRIIFSTLKKFDGVCIRELPVSEVKQIAGRARRYGAKFPIGKVRSPITTLFSEVILLYYRGVWLL